MISTANFHNHPIHLMLVVFPIGLWVFSLISDLIFLANHDEAWRLTALYTLGGGIVGALLAAIPGMIDLFTVQDKNIKRIGLMHMALNLFIVLLYVINLWWRIQRPETMGPIWLSAIAVALLMISGWLGGEMVYMHGAGVNIRSTK